MASRDEQLEQLKRYKHLRATKRVPADLAMAINTFIEQPLAMKMKVLNYLIKKRCNQLIEVVEEFYNG